MNPDTPKYYMPYESDDDTRNDTGSDTDGNTDNGSDGSDGSDGYNSEDLPDYEDARIRREQDPRYAIIAAAGPNFNTSDQQLKYMEHAPGAIYDNTTNISSLNSLVYLNPPKTTQTSLLCIKSSNRDPNVWRTPFNFQLKTPRVYKNVTKFQLVQISFPNNTTDFVNSPVFAEELAAALLAAGVSEDCLSTCVTVSGCTPGAGSIGVAEKGRLNSSGEPMYTSITIPNGRYSNSELANELNINANNTPPFSIISFDTFKNEFKIHRDISILFNEPGDYFQTNVAKVRLGAHSKNDIINTYYSNTHIDSLPVITDNIAFIAYYFPILKELVASDLGNVFIKTASFSYTQVTDYVLGQFLGLNSDIYYTLCLSNQGALDSYRKLFTFELRHINKYIFSYNEDLKRFSCTHNSFHTSLQNDITAKYNALHNYALTVRGLSARSFQSLKTTYANANSVFKSLEAYLSTQLCNYSVGLITNYSYNGGMLHGRQQANTLNEDSNFSQMFAFTDVFGSQLHGNYQGSTFTFTNFLDYHSTISSYYNTVHNAYNTISSVNAYTDSKLHEYISTKYTGVLPYNIIHNSTYHDCRGVPVAFLPHQNVFSSGQKIPNPYLVAESLSNIPSEVLGSYNDTPRSVCEMECCTALEQIVTKWYSCLPVNTVINQFPSYRLGIDFLNFAHFNAISSIFSLTSTSNFDLFMQINEFQSFNNMDIAMNENYSVSNETTGQIKLMSAKILLQGVATGETSETAIQNPILFETPLGKLDKLDFKIYANDGSLTPMWQFFPFELGINEWDATFQIEEQIAYADRNTGFSGNIPTITIPDNPDAFQYLALTSKNNPNNK